MVGSCGGESGIARPPPPMHNQALRRPATTRPSNKAQGPCAVDIKQLLYVLTVAKDGAVPLYFQVASGNVADDQNSSCYMGPSLSPDRKTRFPLRRGLRLTTQKHDHPSTPRSVLDRAAPRTRSEDGAFRELLGGGRNPVAEHIHDKRNDNGEIVDKYSISDKLR